MMNLKKLLFDPMRIGDINIEQQIINHSYAIKFILKYLDRLIDKNKGLLHDIPPEAIKEIKKEIIRELQKEFPNMGIKDE